MLKDAYLRRHDYLRVSITDRCNLRCRYCMPPDGVDFLPHDEVLRNEEFMRLIGVFVSLGVAKVRFTGGEPLLRRGFVDIIEQTRESFPGLELCLTTNGILLRNYIDDLHRLRLKKLNISLDTLSRETYREITMREGLSETLDGIDRALGCGYFDLKINTVLLEETLQGLDSFLDYFSGRDVTLRFIERMPFEGTVGDDAYLPSGLLLERLAAGGDLVRNTHTDTSVAMMYEYRHRGIYPMRIGIIPPVSHKFCLSCSLLRLTSDGHLSTCLHSRADLDLK
ncbi:MAG: radical SAM protein, partial [Chrysiogenales bacterium]